MLDETRSFEALNTAIPRESAGAAWAATRGVRRIGGETALRTIEWGELTARLGAARDLRLALRHDARRNIGDAAASFSDAAAKYFRALQDAEQPVNLAALGQHKSSGLIVLTDGNRVATSIADAPLTRDDARDEQ
jgi:hypothetical protein